MDDFVAALDREIEQLEQALGRDPAYVKLKRLKDIRFLYASPDNGRVVAVLEQRPAPVPPKTRSPSPLRQRMLERAAEFLRGRADPVRTAEIYQDLTDQGFAIGGNSPQNNLSAMLSNSPRFQSHGRSGWTLLSDEEVNARSKMISLLTLEDLMDDSRKSEVEIEETV